MPSTCVLLATYNGEKYLKEQLDSLVAQEYTDFVCYIHDDNSTDRTLEIVHQYCENFPDKFQNIEARGQGGSKNNFMFLLNTLVKGLKKKFRYIAFCDQDDVWLPNKLAVQIYKISQMETESPDTPCLVYSDMEVVDKELRTISNSFIRYNHLNSDSFSYRKLANDNCAAGCSMLINRQLAELAAVSDIKNIYMHDWWCMIICSMVGKIEYLQVPLVLYRQHEANCLGAQKVTVLIKYQMRFEHLKNWKQYKIITSDNLKMKIHQIAALKQIPLVYRQYKKYIDVAVSFETMSKQERCRFILKENFYSSEIQKYWYCICC